MIPPVVTTSSPFFSSESIFCVSFCFLTCGRRTSRYMTPMMSSMGANCMSAPLPPPDAGANREIEAQPDEPEAWFNRGQALAGLGRFAEAADDYERALGLDASASGL